MKVVLEEEVDLVSYHFCLVCGEQYETTSIAAAAYTVQGIRFGRICPSCIKAGPEGIKSRAHRYAEKLKQLTERAEHLVEALDRQQIELPSYREFEDRQHLVSGRY